MPPSVLRDARQVAELIFFDLHALHLFPLEALLLNVRKVVSKRRDDAADRKGGDGLGIGQ